MSLALRLLVVAAGRLRRQAHAAQVGHDRPCGRAPDRRPAAPTCRRSRHSRAAARPPGPCRRRGHGSSCRWSRSRASVKPGGNGCDLRQRGRWQTEHRQDGGSGMSKHRRAPAQHAPTASGQQACRCDAPFGLAGKAETGFRDCRTMMKLDGIAAFVAVAEAGSISEAARRLAPAKSVVSERLAELERSARRTPGPTHARASCR